jgi:hypothetical protein
VRHHHRSLRRRDESGGRKDEAEDFEAAETLAAKAVEAAKDLKCRFPAGYTQATAAAFRGKFERAAEIISAQVKETAQRPDLEFWTHNELTWLRWAMNDLAGALVETEQQRLTALRVKDKKQRTGLMLHALWDKAYLLRDLASRQPKESRAPTLVYAQAARAEYEKLGPKDAGRPILTAWFAALDGDGAAARKAVEDLNIEERDDVQDLHVIWRALKAGGDEVGAQKVAARVQTSRNMYLGLAVYRPLFTK